MYESLFCIYTYEQIMWYRELLVSVKEHIFTKADEEKKGSTCSSLDALCA